MNSKKENQISTFLKKWVRAELIFHFFHLFFHLLSDLLKGKKSIDEPGQVEIFLFSGD